MKKTALVTGGSRGLGKATALELADRGWRVIITGRNPASLRQAAADGADRLETVAGDVTDPVHRHRLSQVVGDRLDLLVNNASHLGPSPLRPLGELDQADIARVFDVNIVAPMALIGELLPSLGGGAIVVNISSDAAVEAYPTWGPYGASKAALDHATRTLAVERPELHVYSFDPGDMRTDMHQAAFPGEDISDRPEPATVVPALLHLISECPPSGRYSASQARVVAA